MSEELLLNDRRGNLIQGLQSRSNYGCKKIFPCRDSNHCPSDPQPQILTTALQVTYLTYSASEFKLALLQSNRDHSKLKNESVKKSLEKSKNVLEEKRKTVKRKICIKKKTHTFTIIAMNCVQEQLKSLFLISELSEIYITVD